MIFRYRTNPSAPSLIYNRLAVVFGFAVQGSGGSTPVATGHLLPVWWRRRRRA